MPVRDLAAHAHSAVDELDQRALSWAATRRHGPLRPILNVFVRSSDLLLPWIAVSAGITRVGERPQRRTLARGWAALALAAIVENGLVKPPTERSRPDPQRLPDGQRRSVHPSTSSFPSGHIGAVTAFSVVIGDVLPRWRTPLSLLAVCATYARVYTGRHYLSDALAGLAIGTAVGTVLARRSVAGPDPSA